MSSPRTLSLHHASLVLPIAAPPILKGCVAVRDGKILWIGPSNRSGDILETLHSPHDALEIFEWSGVLMPGLINAHTHLQYTHMAELGTGRYSGFEDWSLSFGAAYRRDSHDWAAAAASGAQRLLESGTTAAADIVTDPEAGGALSDAGLHGIEYWEVLGQDAARWEAGGRKTTLERLEALRRRTRLPVGLSPHAPYSLDSPVIQDLVDYARAQNIRTHIHLSESAVEDEYVRFGSGPLAIAWGANHDFQLIREGGTGRSPAEYVEELGVLHESCHVAHGIYLTEEDRRLLRRTSTAAALCPRSNAVIGLNPPPLRALLEEGNSIAVGTDSSSSSPSLNVLEDVAELYRLARSQGYRGDDLADRLIRAGTLGGAEAMGQQRSYGALLPGLEANLVVLETNSTQTRDRVEEIASSGTVPVQQTIISGKSVYQRQTAVL